MSESSAGATFRNAVLLVGMAAGAWYFFNHFEIEGLQGLKVHPKSQAITQSDDFSTDEFVPTFVSTTSNVTSVNKPNRLPTLPPSRNLRIATWSLGGFGPAKLDSAKTIERVAAVIGSFDVIAIQQMCPTQRDFVPQLLQIASTGGRRFDYLLGDADRTSGEQMAFFFDTTRVVTDRTQLYTVADPDNRMTNDPFVAWFRAADASPETAWTFSFVNVSINLAVAQAEVAELPRILNAIAKDGRSEDDVILGGLFQADDSYLMTAIAQPSLRAAIRGTPTDIYAKHQTSNLLYNDVLTTEALGRGGVLDFLRRENLSLDEAAQVSPYLPVYAEFTPLEGGLR